MSEQIKDGGQAFPVPSSHLHHKDGMTLRDYFAAQIVGHLSVSPLRQETDAAIDATYAYRVADAMLAAREVKA